MISYDFRLFTAMIADDLRRNSYSEALRKAVTKDSIVLDLGAGTGYFSLLACSFGAKKVYAVEPNPLIELAKIYAHANGYGERIEFIQKLSTDIELEEKADVLIFDLRGGTPFYGSSLSSVIDARNRLVKNDAILIPQIDKVFFTLVEAPGFYAKNIAKLCQDFSGFHMPEARRLLTNRVLGGKEDSETFLAAPKLFTELDYTTLKETSYDKNFNFKVIKNGVVHGLRGWFESQLAEDVSFTNSPEYPETIYGFPFFPLEEEVEVEEGDVVSVDISVKFEKDEYYWYWRTRVLVQGDESKIKVNFNQSTLGGIFSSSDNLRRQSEYFIPEPNLEAEIGKAVLNMMDGETPIGDIADSLAENFPSRFKDLDAALNQVVSYSKIYSK